MPLTGNPLRGERAISRPPRSRSLATTTTVSPASQIRGEGTGAPEAAAVSWPALRWDPETWRREPRTAISAGAAAHPATASPSPATVLGRVTGASSRPSGKAATSSIADEASRGTAGGGGGGAPRGRTPQGHTPSPP